MIDLQVGLKQKTCIHSFILESALFSASIMHYGKKPIRRWLKGAFHSRKIAIETRAVNYLAFACLGWGCILIMTICYDSGNRSWGENNRCSRFLVPTSILTSLLNNWWWLLYTINRTANKFSTLCCMSFDIVNCIFTFQPVHMNVRRVVYLRLAYRHVVIEQHILSFEGEV